MGNGTRQQAASGGGRASETWCGRSGVEPESGELPHASPLRQRPRICARAARWTMGSAGSCPRLMEPRTVLGIHRPSPISPFSLRVRRGGRSGTGWWERPERPSRRTRWVRGRRGFRSHGLLARVLMAHGRAAPMGYVGLARGPLVAPRAVTIGYAVCGRRLRLPRYVVLGGAWC